VFIGLRRDPNGANILQTAPVPGIRHSARDVAVLLLHALPA
jgi:hypothetical protein